MKKTTWHIATFIVFTCAMVALVAAWAYADQEFRSKNLRGSLPTEGHSRAEYPLMAEIFCPEAITTALKVVPGRVYECKLEEEEGFLVYGVEIMTSGGRFMEVQVDAGNGQILFSEEDKPEAKNDICEKLGCD